MACKWPLMKLSDVADVAGGGTPSTKVSEYYGGDISWLTPKDLSGYKKRYISKGERSITQLGLDNSSAKILPKNSVLLTSRAPIGYVAIARNTVTTNQGFKSLILKEDNDPEFFYYLLKSSKDYLESLASGSTFKEISGLVVKNAEFRIPPYKIQKRISRILGVIDERIENNQNVNQTLEQMAQAIFKSWFVDFEPAKAKIAVLDAGGTEEDALLAAMTAISGKNNVELEQFKNVSPEQYDKLKSTAELFPPEMQDSELGEIPEGWEAKPFGELLIKTIGGDWGKDEPDEKHTEKVKILRGTDLPHVYAGYDDKVPTRYVDPKKLATRKLENGDIVIEVSGGSPTQPTGRSLYLTQEIINRLNADLEPASFCRLFRPESKETGLILGLHLQKIYGEGKTWLYQNTSTGISNFQTKMFLEKELLVIPPNEIQQYFFEMVMPYLQKMSNGENKILAELRDTLLPKLLSGELSVSAATDQITQAEEAIDV